MLLNAVDLESPDYYCYYEYQGKYGSRYYQEDEVSDPVSTATGDRTVPANCSTNANLTTQGFSAPCAERIPVFSTGVSFRMNVLGYLVLETYIAHPLQRQFKQWVVGIQAAPGW